jgi:hypothetical protein
LAKLQAAGLAENVVETQLAAIAEFGSPQTGPTGNQARPSWLLRLVTG